MNLTRLQLAGALVLSLLGAAPARAQRGPHEIGPEWSVQALGPADSVGLYGYRTTTNNLCNITFTNYGSWGLGLTSSTVPNFRFPAGTGLEHMIRGGLWVGGKVVCPTCVAGETTAVSFGAIDQNGASGTPLTEWTPLPNTASTRMIERSNLPNSQYYSKQAVSEQDIIARFRDNPGTNVGREPHIALNVDVTESIYSWSFEFAQSFVVQHFTIRNTGDLLRNVYVTSYTEMQSLNTQSYRDYPGNLSPSPYSRKLLTWVPDQRLLISQYCEGQNCNFQKVPAFAGQVLLGTRPTPVDALGWHLLTRRYSGNTLDLGSQYDRSNDVTKYAFMQRLFEFEVQEPGTSDPSQWMTVGPIKTFPRDSVVDVDFAWVGGESMDEIKENARHAQLAFDLKYNLPTPPPSPRLHAAAIPGGSDLEGVDLLWEGSPDTTYDGTGPAGTERDFEGYRIYLGETPSTLRLIAQFDKKDTTSFNTGLDPIRVPESEHLVVDGDSIRYRYRLSGVRTGFKYYVAVTSFDTGNSRITSLESGKTQNRMIVIPGPAAVEGDSRAITVFPNPYRVEARWDAGATSARDHFLWFANLPARCSIKIFTLGGDLVQTVEFDSSYNGADARGTQTPGFKPPALSGSMYAWNLISRFNQAVASGLYLYAVEDRKTGKRHVGKFVVIKSDPGN